MSRTLEQGDSGRSDVLAYDRQLSLWVVHGPAAGAVVALDRPELRVGRSGELDLELHDERVSRQHVAVRPSARGVLVRDLGSRNGGFVDGVPFGAGVEVKLGLGSVLRLGESVLVVAPGPAAPDASDADFPGASQAAAEVRRRLAALQGTGGPVLILGETGTGKERAARALARRDGPVVALNAAQLRPPLASDELFGHAPGAFTGAAERRRGAAAEADGGILFLDEIGDLPFETQAELLRFLEDGTYRPLGASAVEVSAARVVAATHVDLDAAVAKGRFRRDLLARLRSSNRPLVLPPLRARPEDVPAWARAFLAQVRPEWGGADRWSAGAVECLLLHEWPENLRELRGVVRGLVETEPEWPLSSRDLPPLLREARRQRRSTGGPGGSPLPSAPPPEPAAIAPPSAEKIVAALVAANGRMRAAAALLGIERRHLYRLCEKLGVDYAAHRPNGDD